MKKSDCKPFLFYSLAKTWSSWSIDLSPEMHSDLKKTDAILHKVDLIFFYFSSFIQGSTFSNEKQVIYNVPFLNS